MPTEWQARSRFSSERQEDMDISGTATMITGASRGLGQALALELARQGARLVLVSRHLAGLQPVVRRIREAGGEAHALEADIGAKDEVYPLAGAAAALVGPIDLLIHNASELGPTPLRLLLDTECEDFERVLAVNLLGPFRLSRVIAGSMALRERGTIVHVSSDASVNPGEMDTEMHRAALPDANPATLLQPSVVASRIAALIRANTVESGARLELNSAGAQS